MGEEVKRWFCVEQRVRGQTLFIGRVEATPAALREAVGPYAEINPANGQCLIYGKEWTMKNTDIAASGGFNTGRMYRAEGQRIYWAQRKDGWLFFNDIDRMISGWIDADDMGGGPGLAVIMQNYDANRYHFSAPGQRDRNPEVPEGYDFGPKRRL